MREIFKDSRILLSTIAFRKFRRKFQAPNAFINQIFDFLFDHDYETNYPPPVADNHRRRLSLSGGLQSVSPAGWRFPAFTPKIIDRASRTDNGRRGEDATYKLCPLSQMLFQVHPEGDRRRRARNGFNVERVVAAETILSPVAIIDFRLSRFLEQARRSRDAGVDADAAWRNQPSFAGWTIVRIFRDLPRVNRARAISR